MKLYYVFNPKKALPYVLIFIIAFIAGFFLHKLPYFEPPVYTGKGGEDTPLEITTDEYIDLIGEIRGKCEEVKTDCNEMDEKLGIKGE